MAFGKRVDVTAPRYHSALAERLLASALTPNTTPVQSTGEAVARAGGQIAQALLGKKLYDQSLAREEAANQTLADAVKAYGAKPWVNPDTGDQTIARELPPGMEGGAAMIGDEGGNLTREMVPTAKAGGMEAMAAALARNPDTASYGLDMRMQQIGRDQARADQEAERAFVTARDEAKFGFTKSESEADRTFSATQKDKDRALAREKMQAELKVAADKITAAGKYYAVSTGDGIMIMDKGTGMAQMMGVDAQGNLSPRGQPFQPMQGVGGNPMPVPQPGPQGMSAPAGQPAPAMVTPAPAAGAPQAAAGDPQQTAPLMPPSLAAGPQGDVAGAKADATNASASRQKKLDNLPKAQSALVSLKQQAGVVMSTIDKSLGIIKNNSLATGMPGAILGNLANTDARALNNNLMTIKANIGFDKLQEMRANSPTGGALGAVSEMENKLLQAVNGALDPMQKDQLVENLTAIRNLYPQVIAERERAFQQDYGDPAGQVAPQEAVPSPAGDPLAEAREAIAKGAPRDAVLKRLRDNGIDPAGL